MRWLYMIGLSRFFWRLRSLIGLAKNSLRRPWRPSLIDIVCLHLHVVSSQLQRQNCIEAANIINLIVIVTIVEENNDNNDNENPYSPRMVDRYKRQTK